MLGGRPTRESLAKAGMTEAESRDLQAESRTWAGKMLRRFKLISDFYTSPLHQVYAKYRHGYTIVNPKFSPLNVMLDGRNAREVEAAIEGGLVVMHESADGRRVVYVVKTGVPEIRVCLDFARFVIDVTSSATTPGRDPATRPRCGPQLPRPYPERLAPEARPGRRAGCAAGA